MQVMFWIMVCELDLKILDLKNKETGFEKKKKQDNKKKL
jgi:hypothetical protein